VAGGAACSRGVDDELHAEVAVAEAGADEEVVPPGERDAVVAGRVGPRPRRRRAAVVPVLVHRHHVVDPGDVPEHCRRQAWTFFQCPDTAKRQASRAEERWLARESERTESVAGVEVLAVGPAGAAEGPAVAVPDVVGGGRVGGEVGAAAAGDGERHGDDGAARARTASSPSHLARFSRLSPCCWGRNSCTWLDGSLGSVAWQHTRV
jgi:hypothetical protein